MKLFIMIVTAIHRAE